MGAVILCLGRDDYVSSNLKALSCYSLFMPSFLFVLFAAKDVFFEIIVVLQQICLINANQKVLVLFMRIALKWETL